MKWNKTSLLLPLVGVVLASLATTGCGKKEEEAPAPAAAPAAQAGGAGAGAQAGNPTPGNSSVTPQ